MDTKTLLKAMIDAIEQMGGQFVKVDHFDFYFNIVIGSQIDDEVKLKRTKDALMKSFGLGLKIRKIKNK